MVKYVPMPGKGKGPRVVKFGPMLVQGGGRSVRCVRGVRDAVCVLWFALCALRGVRGVRQSAPPRALTHVKTMSLENIVWTPPDAAHVVGVAAQI